jgi:hypothetical protein
MTLSTSTIFAYFLSHVTSHFKPFGGSSTCPLKSSPSSSIFIQGNSFQDIVKRDVISDSCLVQKDPNPSIPMVKDVIS